VLSSQEQPNVNNQSSLSSQHGSYQWLKDGNSVEDLLDGVHIKRDPRHDGEWSFNHVSGRHSGNYSLRYHYETEMDGEVRKESACLTDFLLKVEGMKSFLPSL